VFDTIVMVDWSAANQPKLGRDSIWICRHGEAPVNLATRAEAQFRLAATIAAALSAGQRVLIGFDFPFGYPAGFAARLGLGGRPWRAAWNEIARLLHDDERNRNNRFDIAAELNRRISGGLFPFWGCPQAKAGPHLGVRHHRGHRPGELRERRLVDEFMVGAQPCWKLLGTGSVGGQILTGIPVVRALRDDPRWREVARVWPFETGLQPPCDGSVVFAEVWPSWWDWKAGRRPDEIADAAQVRHVAGVFAARAAAGDLAPLFAGAATLSATERRRVESEEAWMLGVMARRSSGAPRPPSPAREGRGKAATIAGAARRRSRGDR
jgi:precorrin-8X/cobalt-precorrin-8 methylmutase